MYISPFMRALLEAEGDDQAEEQSADTGAEDTGADSGADQSSDASSDTGTDTNDSGTDDSSMDDPFGDGSGDGDGEEDLSNPPDGLASPDDEGDPNDTGSGDDADEQNIQLNILSLSNLDRLTLNQKCFNNFKDLRVKINRAQNLVDDNEQLLESEFRDEVVENLGELYVAVNSYMTIKFSFNNYEENAKTFNIFASQLDEILKSIKNQGNSKDKKVTKQ